MLTVKDQARHCRTEMSSGIVPELADLRVPFESGLHDAALDTASAAMDHSHHPDAGRRCGINVFRDN